jgi:uncharacterized protein
MTSVLAFIRKYPVPTFYILTFAISWGGILLLAGGPAADVDSAAQMEKLFLPVYLTLLAGPAFSSILLAALVDGWAGLRELGSRLRRWRAGARWYVLALLLPPLVIGATLAVLSLASRDFLPRFYTANDKAFLLQFSLISALTVAVFEELGWTGFATPRLRQRYSVLETGLIVGLLKGVWNGLVVYWVSRVTGAFGGLAPALFLAGTLLTWQPTYRVLMVLVHDQTRSLPLVMLMHTSLVAFWTMFTPLEVTGASLVTYYLLLTAALWIVIGVVALRNRAQLSPQPPRQRMA